MASSNQLRFFKTRLNCTSNGTRARSLLRFLFSLSSVFFFLFFFSLYSSPYCEVIKRGRVSLISTILFPSLSLSVSLIFTMFHVYVRISRSFSPMEMEINRRFIRNDTYENTTTVNISLSIIPYLERSGTEGGIGRYSMIRISPRSKPKRSFRRKPRSFGETSDRPNSSLFPSSSLAGTLFKNVGSWFIVSSKVRFIYFFFPFLCRYLHSCNFI